MTDAVHPLVALALQLAGLLLLAPLGWWLWIDDDGGAR